MTVDNETYFALVEEQLAAGGQVKIPLVGTSMQPTLLAGDVIVLEKAHKIGVGDVVLFRYKGDNCITCETAKKEDIVAKMVLAEKKHPLRHMVVRWLGPRGRKQLRPWYFLCLAFLMWAPLGGVPLDNFMLGLRMDHLLHASVFIPCSLFIYDLYKRKWVVWPTAVAIGVLTESVQALLPYRGFDINDMIANFLGVSLGWIIILTIKHKHQKRTL